MVKKTGIKPDERTVSYIMRGALLVLRKSGTNVPIGPIGLKNKIFTKWGNFLKKILQWGFSGS